MALGAASPFDSLLWRESPLDMRGFRPFWQSIYLAFGATNFNIQMQEVVKIDQTLWLFSFRVLGQPDT
jgi:hypothetical protein